MNEKIRFKKLERVFFMLVLAIRMILIDIIIVKWYNICASKICRKFSNLNFSRSSQEFAAT